MSHTLSPEQQQIVANLIDGNQFHSADEVLTVALHLFQELQIRHRDRLKQAISRGFSQLQNGDGIVLRDESELQSFFDDIKNRGQERFAARRGE